MAAQAGWKVEVTGLRQTIDALNEVDKSAVRAITKVITDAGKAVKSAAAGMITEQPVSNWGPWDGARDLGFDPGAVAAGFKLRKSNFRRRGVSAGIGWDVVQTSAAGAIFEVMGDGTRTTTPQGEHLVDMVNSRYPGKTPRVLIPAYRAGMPKDLADTVATMIEDAARKAGLI